jgi:putative membrane fusion protein
MKGSKIFKYALIFLGAIFIMNQLFSSWYMPIKTENAVYYTTNDGFKVSGQIIRNETLVTSDTDGVFHFLISDGIRVSKDGVIANIYTSTDSSITVSKIDVLKTQIADIEDVLSYNDIEAANLELINSKIAESLGEMIFESANGNYGKTDGLSKNLLSVNNRKQVALGDTTGLSDRLETLKNELNSLTNSLSNPISQITAKSSGYFISKTDGYENVLKGENLEKLTPEFMSSVKPEETGANVIGKIVPDYEWYIAATVSLNDSLQYKEGQSVKLLTNVKSATDLTATVKRINISEKAETAVLLFACSDMNSELANMRNISITVVNKEYSGLRISQKALRVVDSQKGVYVKTGMQIKFVPVEIVYRNDDYIICEKQNENSDCLKLYDNVVVKGRNLYDGKIVG